MYNLNRFLAAQENVYPIALEEIKAGEKQSHWMWYIFPQHKALGHSHLAKYYGLENIDETKEYFEHPTLRHRLVEITQALLSLPDNDPTAIMGYPDDLKLRSSMTIFWEATHEPIFQQVLDKFFDGEEDKLTLQYIAIQISIYVISTNKALIIC